MHKLGIELQPAVLQLEGHLWMSFRRKNIEKFRDQNSISISLQGEETCCGYCLWSGHSHICPCIDCVLIGLPEVRSERGSKSHARIAYAIVKDFEWGWIEWRVRKSTEVHQLWNVLYCFVCFIFFSKHKYEPNSSQRCPCVGLRPLGPWIYQGKIIASWDFLDEVFRSRGRTTSYYIFLVSWQGTPLHIFLSWTGVIFRRSRATLTGTRNVSVNGLVLTFCSSVKEKNKPSYVSILIRVMHVPVLKRVAIFSYTG